MAWFRFWQHLNNIFFDSLAHWYRDSRKAYLSTDWFNYG